MIDKADLTQRFKFHPARDSAIQKAHEDVRNICRHAAEDIVSLIPAGREQSLVVTKLEEAMMWANAGIARAPGADSGERP